MNEIEEIVYLMDEIEKERRILKAKYKSLGLKKITLNIRLMKTPEMREAYKEAYRKIRYPMNKRKVMDNEE